MALDRRIIIASVLVLVGVVSALTLAGSLFVHQSNLITVVGSLEPGVEAGCVILHTDDGKQYLLTGWSNYPPYGTRVTVTGYVETAVASYCMQGNPAIHVASIVRELSFSQTTTKLSISHGTGSVTASSATVIGGSTLQLTTMSGVQITASGYIYTVVESPQCSPQCGMPSFLLTYLYIPSGTSCKGTMECYPPPQYYRFLKSDGNPFPPTPLNGTHVTALRGLLVTPSSWNCESLYVPKICLFGDIYVQSLTH